jgi:hypothetical protein
VKQESKRDIVKRLRESLTAQQRSVPQLPAQARARKISVLGAKTDPKHPFDGYMVGADESAEPDAALLGEFAPSPGYPGYVAPPTAPPGGDGNEGRSFPRRPQKFHAGQVVWIKDLSDYKMMSHFPSNCPAIVNYSYEEKFGDEGDIEVYRDDCEDEDDYKSALQDAEYEANREHQYDVIVMSKDYVGESAWYEENQLTLIPKNNSVESVFNRGNAVPFNNLPKKVKQKLARYFANPNVNEADFNPGRRGFLKKAGAVAATAAMPTGLAGAAAKAVAPAAS